MKSTSTVTKAILTMILSLMVLIFASQAFAQGGTWVTKATKGDGSNYHRFHLFPASLSALLPWGQSRFYDFALLRP